MSKIYFIILIGFVSLLLAEDHQYKNSLGWKSGLFYRRSITEHYWMGINVGGTYNANQESSNGTNQSINSDTSYFTTYQNYDTSVNYSGTIRIEIGREVFVYKKVGIEAFIAGGYKRSKYRTVNFTNAYNPRINNEPSHSVIGIIAAEPKVWLWNRLALGTQLGVQYTYTFYKSNHTYRYTSINSTYSTAEESSTSRTSHSIELFGNVSLNSSLLLQYYF
jgi:hypothetical protein